VDFNGNRKWDWEEMVIPGAVKVAPSGYWPDPGLPEVPLPEGQYMWGDVRDYWVKLKPRAATVTNRA
jgi:hypothetical protein